MTEQVMDQQPTPMWDRAKITKLDGFLKLTDAIDTA